MPRGAIPRVQDVAAAHRSAIIPAAVGVDIGCGMAAVRTQYHRDELGPDLSTLRGTIERAVPLSAGSYNTTLTRTAERRIELLTGKADKAGFNPARYAGNWTLQLGTLGSGNHFIEVTADETGAVWLFLHSGSRGVGNKIARHHIRVAQEAMKRWWITLPDPDLAYLPEGTDEFWAYIRELRWAQDFELANRDEMRARRKTPCHYQHIPHPRACGKTPVVAHNRRPSVRIGTPWGNVCSM